MSSPSTSTFHMNTALMQYVLNRLYGTQDQDLADKMTLPCPQAPRQTSYSNKTTSSLQTKCIDHQIQGTAIMAPSYANIFMAELEEKLLKNYPKKTLLWKRCIDDIFCIWPGPPSELDLFMQYLNQAHPTINTKVQPKV